MLHTFSASKDFFIPFPFPVQGVGNICGHQGVQNPSPTISYIVSANSTQIAYLQSTIIVTRILSENDLERYSCSIDTNLFWFVF